MMKGKHKVGGRAAALALCLLLGPMSATGISGNATGPNPARNATLERRYDAVIISGEALAPLLGEQADMLRLYAFRRGGLHPIPFQIDERDALGEFIFTSGPQASKDADGGTLDYNDELVFMARDAGDRAPAGTRWPEGTRQWSEIELTDPLAQSRKAWAYLFSFIGESPPPSDRDYIRYNPQTERIFSDHYGLGYREGMSLYTDLFYPAVGGDMGPDLLDRVKVKIVVKFFFNVLEVRKTEEDFHAEVVAWKDGPVRVLRNTQNFVRILFNLSSASVFSVSEYYPYYMFTPLRVTVPFDLKWVFNRFGISDWYWHFYGDLPGLEGGLLYSNRNREGIPISTDLSMDWYTDRFDTSGLVWGYATKEGAGTWFCNMVIPDSTYQFVKLHLNIDRAGSYPPEDVPGEVAGGAMTSFKAIDPFLWDSISSGTYELGLETFFAPPGLRPEGVREWLNIREFPVQSEITRSGPARAAGAGSAGNEAIRIDPALLKKGTAAIVTDLRGRKTLLYGVHLHIGSMRTTGLDFAIGQELGTGQWHRIALDDIKVMEHFREAENRTSGMDNPMASRITRRDGTVLEITGCKPCTISGYLDEDRRTQYRATELMQVEFIGSE
ncbi:hypothetical protein ACFL4G_12325 [Thermodesulfobacteriota bacterium]